MLIGFLLLVYLPIEFTLLVVTKTIILEKIIIYFNVKKWIKYNLPPDWDYDISIVTISSKEVYIKATANKPINDYSNWTNDWVTIRRYKVVKSSLPSRIKEMDPSFDVVQHQRNIKLNKLV